LPQAGERDREVAPLGCEPVLVALGPLAVTDAVEDPFLDEPAAVGEDVAGDSEALLELSKRRSPRNASRMISSVHRSPTISSARATEQSCPS
jgi:hypothetical protein